MSGLLDYLILFRLAGISFLILLTLIILRIVSTRPPLKNHFFRKVFPIAGTFVFVIGTVGFIISVSTYNGLINSISLADLSLSGMFLGLSLIGLVADKSEEPANIDFGPSL